MKNSNHNNISKRKGNYKIKWNTDSVKNFIKSNNINVELLSEYIDIYTKMDFKCSCGNIFKTNWHEFNNKKYPKRQCNKCGRKKLNDKNKVDCNFIKQYLSENNYTCKLISNKYINCEDKLEFECECGNIFHASWSNIKKMKGLCKKCSTLIKSINNRKSDKELQQQIDSIYGDNKFVFIDRDCNNITLEHLICGNKFKIKKSYFIDGCGCKFCNKKNMDYGRLSNKDFLNKLNSMSNILLDKFTILSDYKSNNVPVKIKCKECGETFKQQPMKIYERGIYCPICNGSRGEQYIAFYLRSKNIKYIPQYRFSDCRYLKPLPFDFYLPDYNICIEFQGQQHYKPVEIFGGESTYEYQKERDKLKRDYCLKNDIVLIEINYKNLNNINHILDNSLLYSKGVV